MPTTAGFPTQATTPVGTDPRLVSPQTKTSAFCRQYKGGRWQDVGMCSRDACIAAALKRGFTGYAQYGFTRLRRYDGYVETKINGQWMCLDDRTTDRPAVSSR